jgi:hypothetical protein
MFTPTKSRPPDEESWGKYLDRKTFIAMVHIFFPLSFLL